MTLMLSMLLGASLAGSYVCAQQASGMLPNQTPHEDVGPEQLPLFSFLRKLKLDRVAEPRTYFTSNALETSTSPAWLYHSALKAQPRAHLLKGLLIRKEGWVLTFPALNFPYDGRAEHMVNQHVDWKLWFDRYGDVFVWDDSKRTVVTRKAVRVPPGIHAPYEQKLFTFLRKLTKGEPTYRPIKALVGSAEFFQPAWYFKPLFSFKETGRKLRAELVRGSAPTGPGWLEGPRLSDSEDWTHFWAYEKTDWSIFHDTNFIIVTNETQHVPGPPSDE